ncbi:hypothetical protein RHSIM_Rhsim09G0000200 [Rhododendron simsii]|uniref:Gfo/Idh/MocA-like oxidoreductase N-terminal domain-containing protein n=1 Tax=Rhododendron simsii TaxID=118357 RepID=A0A834GJ59_RHOSS|nr:hypothetical protein RHSIM_Rhsim09G0000200 [Rhododendron simsii]
MGEKIVNYGIVGVGLMGREHLLNLYHLRIQNVAVVCIADPHLPSQQHALDLATSFNWPLKGDLAELDGRLGGAWRLREIWQELGFYKLPYYRALYHLPLPKVFSGHQELLDSGMCDVVVVSTPNMTHYQILMDIINHPKPHHVLVEKPLCTTVMDCRKVIEAARKRPEMLVQVGLEYRYMPPVAKLIEIVKGGALGQIKMVAIREHRFPFLVKVNNWNRFNCNSGGTLVEKCCHFFDLMRLFAGANPVRVMASGGVDVNHKDEIYDGKVKPIITNNFGLVLIEHGLRMKKDLHMYPRQNLNLIERCVLIVISMGNTASCPYVNANGVHFDGQDFLKFQQRREDFSGLASMMALAFRTVHKCIHIRHWVFVLRSRSLNCGLIAFLVGFQYQQLFTQRNYIRFEGIHPLT